MGEKGRQAPPGADGFISGTPQTARDLVTDVVAGAEVSIASLAQGPEPEVRKGERMDLVATHIPGFYLAVTKGMPAPDMSRSEVDATAVDVRIYYLRDQIINQLALLQEPLHDRMIQRGMRHEGFRGGQDDNLGGQVQANPTRRINEDLVNESLGKDAREFLHPKTVVSIELTPGVDDIEGITRALKGALKRRKIDSDRLKIKETLSVDREKLLKAVEKGEITLLPETITVGADKDKDWQVTPRTVLTLPAVQEAVRRAAESFGLRNPDPEVQEVERETEEGSSLNDSEAHDVFPGSEAN